MEGDQGCRLSRVTIPRPGLSVAPVHEDRAEVVLEQVRAHGVGGRPPHALEEGVGGRREISRVVDGFALHHQPQPGQREGRGAWRDGDEAISGENSRIVFADGGVDIMCCPSSV